MTKDKIKDILQLNPELKDKLFCRGFIFTDADVNINDYPFYNGWRYERIGIYNLLVSNKQNYYIRKIENNYYIIIGHAYNPISNNNNELNIIESLASNRFNEYNCNINKLNELTGIFSLICIEGNNLTVFGDAACMQTTFFGNYRDKLYVSSHSNLISDLTDIKWDPYVKHLSCYKFFSLMGNSLPGDLSQFKEIKRLTPNFCAIYKDANWNIKRFYLPKKLELSREEIVNSVANILNMNMTLIATKWKNPAISCTGGCDSKTTMACTIGLYNKFKYFSYISNESEKVDADAAKAIVASFGQTHKTYIIPNTDSDISLVNEVRSILEWNTGNITPNNRNDVRKRRFFEDIKDFDIEVKSWVSEVGRAYYSKRFNGRKNFGDKPTPRKCTTMYKFFLHDRTLVRQTDKVFKDFLDKYFQQDPKHPIDWQEQLFWEFRCPSWNGLVITGEHRYSFDITIPYNNRLLLELLLSASIDDRINDTIYKLVREKMNPEIDKTGISITNVKHTDNRARLEDIYYLANTYLMF